MAKKLDKNKLVIVESPAKAKTIEKILGRTYKVISSYGHIIDLPKTKIGVDVNDNFKPSYHTIKGKGPIIKQLKEAAKTIYEKSNHEVVGAGFDSLNNYYAIGMKNKGIDFTKELDFASDASKEVVKYYADGIRDGYFRIAGSDKYLSAPFQNKKVAMYVGSTAGESFVAKGAKEAGFEYGVAVRPEKYDLQQGTDIYMFEGSTTEEQRTAAFLYLKFLSSAESQLYWAQQTGYMPTIASVLEQDAYKNSGSKVPKILADATKNLFSIPVVENSDPAYSEVRTILEKIFTTQNGNVDQLIQDSKAQFDAAWNQ